MNIDAFYEAAANNDAAFGVISWPCTITAAAFVEHLKSLRLSRQTGCMITGYGNRELQIMELGQILDLSGLPYEPMRLIRLEPDGFTYLWENNFGMEAILGRFEGQPTHELSPTAVSVIAERYDEAGLRQLVAATAPEIQANLNNDLAAARLELSSLPIGTYLP